MVENFTQLSKVELVTLNPSAKTSKKISIVLGSIILIFAISTLFVSDYNVFSTIMFFILGVFQLIVAFGSNKLALRRKGLPEYVKYEYNFGEEEASIKMITPDFENNLSLQYSNIIKYKFYNDVHFIYISKYLFYIVKDNFKNEEDRAFFLSKVDLNSKK